MSESAPDIFFDDDHYRDYRAVLVRLPVVALDELDSLLCRACDFQAARQKAQAGTSYSTSLSWRIPRNGRFVPYPVTLIGANRGLGRALAET
jgi:hypothetical protein